EDAATESDPAKRRELLTFIIVGAGPVGVELASSLRDLMDHTLRRIYPTIDFRREVTIHLLDSADRVIQQIDVRLSRIAIGRRAAGAELAGLGGIVMGGLPAWTVWRANYLMQLLGARNRGTLLVEWVLSYFAGRLVANTP